MCYPVRLYSPHSPIGESRRQPRTFRHNASPRICPLRPIGLRPHWVWLASLASDLLGLGWPTGLRLCNTCTLLLTASHCLFNEPITTYSVSAVPLVFGNGPMDAAVLDARISQRLRDGTHPKIRIVQKIIPQQRNSYSNLLIYSNKKRNRSNLFSAE